MPRPGPRPYECVRRAWHSETHQPLRGALIQEIFRIVNEIHNPITRRKKEWQEKLPIVVLRAEEILYSKANSEGEYADVKSLRSRLDDAVNTMIRREETEEDGVYIAPCIEAALSLGCTPRKVPRGQRAPNFLSNSAKRSGPISANSGSRSSMPEQPALAASASLHSSIGNSHPSFSAPQHSVGLSNYCIGTHVWSAQPNPGSETPHSSSSSSSHLLSNVHSDSRSAHSKGISSRIDRPQVQSLHIASDSHRLLNEASYADQTAANSRNAVSGCARTDFLAHDDRTYYCQDTRFNFSPATLLSGPHQLGFSRPLLDHRELPHPSQLYCETALMLMPSLSHPSQNPLQVSLPSFSSHPTSVPPPMPSSHGSPAQAPCPSSSSCEATTAAMVPSYHTPEINVASSPQQIRAFDLQLRLGPPMLSEPRVANNRTCSENVLSRSSSGNDPMVMASDDKLQCVQASLASDSGMHPSKRIKVGIQSPDTLPSMQYDGPPLLQQFSQPQG